MKLSHIHSTCTSLTEILHWMVYFRPDESTKRHASSSVLARVICKLPSWRGKCFSRMASSAFRVFLDIGDCLGRRPRGVRERHFRLEVFYYATGRGDCTGHIPQYSPGYCLIRM